MIVLLGSVSDIINLIKYCDCFDVLGLVCSEAIQGDKNKSLAIFAAFCTLKF